MWESEPKLCEIYMEAKVPDLISRIICAVAWPNWVSNRQKTIQTSGCGDKFANMGRLCTMGMYYSICTTALLSVIEMSP